MDKRVFNEIIDSLKYEPFDWEIKMFDGVNTTLDIELEHKYGFMLSYYVIKGFDFSPTTLWQTIKLNKALQKCAKDNNFEKFLDKIDEAENKKTTNHD